MTCEECEDTKPEGCPECSKDIVYCPYCGEVVDTDDFEEDKCSKCRANERDQAELESDYRFWTR